MDFAPKLVKTCNCFGFKLSGVTWIGCGVRRWLIDARLYLGKITNIALKLNKFADLFYLFPKLQIYALIAQITGFKRSPFLPLFLNFLSTNFQSHPPLIRLSLSRSFFMLVPCQLNVILNTNPLNLRSMQNSTAFRTWNTLALALRSSTSTNSYQNKCHTHVIDSNVRINSAPGSSLHLQSLVRIICLASSNVDSKSCLQRH